MAKKSHETLSRRERQIMDILYRRSSATAAEVHAEIPAPPSYSAVRAALRVLAEKGHVTFKRRSHHYVFRPTVSRRVAQRTAAERMLTTFFDGSASSAVAALLDCAEKLDPNELDELSGLIEAARKEGR